MNAPLIVVVLVALVLLLPARCDDPVQGMAQQGPAAMKETMTIEDIPFDHSDYPRVTRLLSRDQCPDCDGHGFDPGPRGGLAQNIFCRTCGQGFNVGPSRDKVWFVQRIGNTRP